MSVLNAPTAMKTSQVLVRSISTNTDVLRVHWQGLGVVIQVWNPQPRAGATGHKPQITRGGWCCQGSSHAHKLQFTSLRLRTEAPSGPSLLAKPCRLSLNQFSHSLSALCSTDSADHVCHRQYHCDTNPGASEGLTQQEQNKLLLSSQRLDIKM